MDNIKKFIKEERQYNLSYNSQDKSEGYSIKLNDLGLFFWERGGKQFVDYCFTLQKLVKDKPLMNITDLIFNAKDETENDRSANAQDFLDCVACLGESKVKELIKNE